MELYGNVVGHVCVGKPETEKGLIYIAQFWCIKMYIAFRISLVVNYVVKAQIPHEAFSVEVILSWTIYFAKVVKFINSLMIFPTDGGIELVASLNILYVKLALQTMDFQMLMNNGLVRDNLNQHSCLPKLIC